MNNKSKCCSKASAIEQRAVILNAKPTNVSNIANYISTFPIEMQCLFKQLDNFTEAILSTYFNQLEV